MERQNVGSGGGFESVYDYRQVARAHREVLGEVRPAATLVQVGALLDPRMRVEIEVYAVDS
jgi:enamine deaminase RidA (YjgF/YER057c/UK114 family)